MKKFEKFLFSYSILVVTIFFISFGIISPKPINLISIVFLTPIVLYFWIRLTSPNAVNVEMWSVRFLFVLVILGALGVYGYRIASFEPKKLAETAQLSLTSLKTIIPDPTPKALENRAYGESLADLLIEVSPTPQAGFKKITSKPNVDLIDVYQNPSITSKKIGGLDAKLNYPYLTISDGWYEIIMTSTTSGWVNSSQVQEVY